MLKTSFKKANVWPEKPICAAVRFWIQILFHNYATQNLKQGWAQYTLCMSRLFAQLKHSEYITKPHLKVSFLYVSRKRAKSSYWFIDCVLRFHFIQGLCVAERTSFICGVYFRWHWYSLHDFMIHGNKLKAVLCVNQQSVHVSKSCSKMPRVSSLAWFKPWWPYCVHLHLHPDHLQ